jgi:hypothetical protein
MKRVLIAVATVGVLAPAAWVVEANAQYGAPAPAYSAAPAYGPSQTYAPSRKYARRAYRRSARARDRLAVISSTPRALVRRPMTFLVKSMPVKALARGSGTPLPARISGAICALPTPTPCVATDSRGSAKSEGFVHSCMNG